MALHAQHQGAAEARIGSGPASGSVSRCQGAGAGPSTPPLESSSGCTRGPYGEPEEACTCAKLSTIANEVKATPPGQRIARIHRTAWHDNLPPTANGGTKMNMQPRLSINARHWPEVCDAVARFCTIREPKYLYD